MGTITKAMSDTAIASEVYARLEARRKSMSFTQEEIAEKIGITPKSYRALETGTCRLTTFIATLRHLDMLDNLDKMISPIAVSPLEELKLSRADIVRKSIENAQYIVMQTRSSDSARHDPKRVSVRKRRFDVCAERNRFMARRKKLIVKG